MRIPKYCKVRAHVLSVVLHQCQIRDSEENKRQQEKNIIYMNNYFLYRSIQAHQIFKNIARFCKGIAQWLPLGCKGLGRTFDRSERCLFRRKFSESLTKFTKQKGPLSGYIHFPPGIQVWYVHSNGFESMNTLTTGIKLH